MSLFGTRTFHFLYTTHTLADIHILLLFKIKAWDKNQNKLTSLSHFLDCPSYRTGAIVTMDGHSRPQSRTFQTLWDRYEDGRSGDIIAWWTFTVNSYLQSEHSLCNPDLCFIVWTAAGGTWMEQQWEDRLRFTGSSHHPTPVLITPRLCVVVEPPKTHARLFLAEGSAMWCN